MVLYTIGFFVSIPVSIAVAYVASFLWWPLAIIVFPVAMRLQGRQLMHLLTQEARDDVEDTARTVGALYGYMWTAYCLLTITFAGQYTETLLDCGYAWVAWGIGIAVVKLA